MKRLTMDNIKEFVENKVYLEWLNVDNKDDEWEEYPYTFNKSDIIKDMIDLNYYFRYRIQEKKEPTIKKGDWVVHNYMGFQCLEIFKVGKIVDNDKVYNDYGGCITQFST